MASINPEGFFALPPSEKGPAVLVLHAWWGLNVTIKAFCARLAEAGFAAFALDLYHGQVADTIPGAEALGQGLDSRYLEARAEIASAAAFLNEHANPAGSGLAVVGFSLGAFYALDLSANSPEHIHSVVLFYGTGPAEFVVRKQSTSVTSPKTTHTSRKITLPSWKQPSAAPAAR